MKINVRMLTAAVCILLSLAAYFLLNDKSRDTDNSIGLFDRTGGDNSDFSESSATDGKPNSNRNDTPRRTMEMPAPVKGKKEMLMTRQGYYVSYNKDTKVPNWVAWHLTAAHTKGNNYRDGMMFEEDYDVPSPRATDYDYSHSKYDRGHMCPSGDNKWDKNAQRQSFLLTNVCPQNHALNKVIGTTWKSNAGNGRNRWETFISWLVPYSMTE